MDAVALGRYVLPALETLAGWLPHLRCATLCTADGFNVCSIGISEAQLGKLAALAGSLLTLGDATLASLHDGAKDGASAPGIDLLTLEAGHWLTVAVRVSGPGQPLVLLVSVTQTPLGVLHLRARQTAEQLSNLLGHSSTPANRQSHGDLRS